jgi:hypothetical protein
MLGFFAVIPGPSQFFPPKGKLRNHDGSIFKPFGCGRFFRRFGSARWLCARSPIVKCEFMTCVEEKRGEGK